MNSQEASTSCTPSTFGKQGLILHSQAREIVANVIDFIKKESEHFGRCNEPLIPLKNFRDRVITATGISRQLYTSITRESRKVASGESTSFSTPRKKRQRRRKYELVEGEKHAIRTIVNEFHITEKRMPTINGIIKRLHDIEIPLECGRTRLRGMLKELGFRWGKTQDNRKMLMEGYDIRFKRIHYLKQLKEFKTEGRPIFFTDESYIHTSHLPKYSWSDGTSKGIRLPISKGRRLIMVHAGSEAGFVNNGLLLFPSGTKSGDYHDDMNWENFEKWATTQLIPNLPPKSVLIVDNASYHNTKELRDPTMATKKGDMVNWLKNRNIPVDERLLKPEIYNLVKIHKETSPSYKLNTLLNQYGHTVLRLPPYHPELNPIEKIWAEVKQWVATHNVSSQNMKNLIALTKEAFEKVTNENWQKVCCHVDKIVDDYFHNEPLLDSALEKIEFTINTGSSDEEEEEEEDDDDDQEDHEVYEVAHSDYESDLGVAPLY